jgi:hypothetical protein
LHCKKTWRKIPSAGTDVTGPNYQSDGITFLPNWWIFPTLTTGTSDFSDSVRQTDRKNQPTIFINFIIVEKFLQSSTHSQIFSYYFRTKFDPDVGFFLL